VAPIQQFDAMIVGAGPAGVSTWMHLKKTAPVLADHTVLIDKAAFPRPKLCGGGLWAWSEPLLEALEIEADFPALPIAGIVFRFKDERWAYRGTRPFRTVRRTEFDMALVTSARKRGLTFIENEAFIGARREGNALNVRTSRGEYRVKALVGADGALSRVRRSMIGRHPPACLAPTLQVSAPADPRCDPEFGRNEMLIDLTPVEDGLQGYVWHFPFLQDGLPFMKHGIGDFRRMRARPRADLKALFRRELRARRLAAAPDTWSSYPVRWFSPRVPIACPHVLLVGDAAGIDCALGGGIHMALSYGETAARVLTAAFQTQDFSFRDYRSVLMAGALGRDIDAFARLARRMYAGQGSPLAQVRDFFTERRIRNTLAALLGRPPAAPKSTPLPHK